MGLDYSLCAVYERNDDNEILKCLRPRLREDSADRLTLDSCVPDETCTELYGPTGLSSELVGGGIKGCQMDRDYANDFCFCFAVTLEEQYRNEEWPDSFGCMWTSFYVTKNRAILEMTAATTSMSYALCDSKILHEFWADFCKDSQAMMGYIDVEECRDTHILYPEFKKTDFGEIYEVING